MNEKVKSIFKDVAERNEEVEDMVDEFRNLLVEKEINEEEYDFILENWDNLLEELGF